MSTAFIIGWVVLIASWVVPTLIKDKQNKSLTGIVLSALATGIFVGSILEKYL